jgi:hypothetical protein
LSNDDYQGRHENTVVEEEIDWKIKEEMVGIILGPE